MKSSLNASRDDVLVRDDHGNVLLAIIEALKEKASACRDLTRGVFGLDTHGAVGQLFRNSQIRCYVELRCSF